ncbi:TraR/DksA family transcriptional regulator [Wenzhouxiangella sediminis]|jgi:DnaK suppressor protein|uniref:TraR/DksA family transcriptional regulator n=1 Tax=Wenzhouxiangella sediminis TaxID=1792836 RepID=A0A3E1KCP6_9GAMM|nr:TraR/DksA C4-type zinc finger protein [Wenzhouxiangella sediminis]RFF32732.1 TraR/DksA family transcriptional regulator [Wenzhouxiangella sediminis]
MSDFEHLIRERIAELEDLAEASRAATATVELDQTRQGRLSRMDALQGQAMAKDAERRRAVQVSRLKVALARLERGEFGECQECGEMIADARLRADPATTRCLACASEAERRQ